MSKLYLDQARYFKIYLGTLLFYAQSYQITGSRTYAEQPAVSGRALVSNSAPRARRIILEGKLLCQEDPSNAILELDRLLEGYVGLSIQLHTMWLVVSRLVRYTVQESSTESMLDCRVELICENSMQKRSGSTESSDSDAG